MVAFEKCTKPFMLVAEVRPSYLRELIRWSH